MIRKIFHLIFGQPEPEFLRGQRVRLISHYPADLADEAHKRTIYGTVQTKTDWDFEQDYLRGITMIPVLWDDFDGVRDQPASSISGVIFNS